MVDSPQSPQNPGSEPDEQTQWDLCLYIAGQSPHSLAAVDNLKKVCNDYLAGCHLEIVDLHEHPERAELDDILAVPTLVRRRPAPTRKIIGDFSETDQLLNLLQVRAHS